MMPTINKLPKKEKTTKRNEHTDSRELRHKAYNTTRWRKLRMWYLQQHPICEDCLKKGIVTPACDVHHIKSFVQNGEVNYNLLYDDNNLAALCKECHSLRHNIKKESTPEEILKALDDLFQDVED